MSHPVILGISSIFLALHFFSRQVKSVALKNRYNTIRFACILGCVFLTMLLSVCIFILLVYSVPNKPYLFTIYLLFRRQHFCTVFVKWVEGNPVFSRSLNHFRVQHTFMFRRQMRGIPSLSVAFRLPLF